MALVRGSLLVVAYFFVAVIATSEEIQQPAAVADNQEPTHSLESSEDFRDSLKSKAFLGSYRTLTRTGVSIFTSTVFMTCLSGFETTLCAGRKKRNAKLRVKRNPMLDTQLIVDQNRDSSIDSSQSEGTEIDTADDEERGRLVGGVYTIWNTATTSTTVTTRYTDSATTVSLSYYCTVRNMDLPLVFC